MDTESVSLESGEREPTAEEWQAVLIQVFDEDPLVEGTIEYFLRRSKSGEGVPQGIEAAPASPRDRPGA